MIFFGWEGNVAGFMISNTLFTDPINTMGGRRKKDVITTLS